jgi:hypothetical protein
MCAASQTPVCRTETTWTTDGNDLDVAGPRGAALASEQQNRSTISCAQASDSLDERRLWLLESDEWCSSSTDCRTRGGAYSAQRGAEAKSPSTLHYADQRRGGESSRPERVLSGARSLRPRQFRRVAVATSASASFFFLAMQCSAVRRRKRATRYVDRPLPARGGSLPCTAGTAGRLALMKASTCE